MNAIKVLDREIVVTRRFAAPREAVFDAITQANHLGHWMKPANMTLRKAEVDLRVGGSLNYVFQRASGKRLEVRGAYTMVDRPHGFAYRESYDFSPLEVMVGTTLDEAGPDTIFTQTITYPSEQERDDDFDGVAASAEQVYGELDRYLESRK